MRKTTEHLQKQFQDMVIVRKSNDLIEARYKMTMWEARVWDKFLSILRKEKDIKDEYKIPISEIIENYQLQDDKRAFQRIIQAAHALQDRYITNSTISRDEFRHLRSHIFASVETVVTNDGDSYILFEVPRKIKPILTATNERYKDFALENFIGISSFYSKRVYELLKQYERIGERTFTIEDLRNVLAIEETEYKLYGHFKKRIVDKAQEDLLRCTDISFTYEELKKRGSKQVTSIRFIIKSNKAQRLLEKSTESVPKTKTPKIREIAQLPLFELSNDPVFTDFELIAEDKTAKKNQLIMSPLFEKYFAIVSDWWGVEQAEFIKRLEGREEAQVLQAIEYTKNRIKVGKALNPAGVFLDALSKGYKTAEQIKTEKQEEKARLAREKAEKLKPLIDEYEGLEKNYSHSINDAIRSITKSHPEATDTAIEKIKTTYRRLGMTDIMDKTTEDFRQNPMLRNIVMSEIMNQYPSVFEAIKDDFEQKKAIVKQKIQQIDPNYVFKK
ncbi:MAG: replication initiation protein [Saprospiraceae bacterium]|nr:replication initiation protein [Saprospiraceae bacterium]